MRAGRLGAAPSPPPALEDCPTQCCKLLCDCPHHLSAQEAAPEVENPAAVVTEQVGAPAPSPRRRRCNFGHGVPPLRRPYHSSLIPAIPSACVQDVKVGLASKTTAEEPSAGGPQPVRLVRWRGAMCSHERCDAHEPAVPAAKHCSLPPNCVLADGGAIHARARSR